MLRPRLKSVFPPTPLAPGRIAIGGIDAGFAAELDDDESGHVWQLLNLLDGTRDRDEVVAEMRRRDPELSADDVDAAVAALRDEGYLEDAAAEPPPGLFSDVELTRYRRNADFLSFFSPPDLHSLALQGRLRRARVVVIGLGGLGAAVAANLAAAGVGALRVVDFDTVELSNLNRQVLYTEADLGESKARAAARRLHQVNPHVTTDIAEVRITSPADARSILRGYDFLVCAADRPRVLIHEWLNEAAAAERMPWAWGSNAGLTVQMGLVEAGHTGCFECEARVQREEIPWYDAARRWQVDVLGERDVNPCIAPVSTMLGGFLALDVLFHLTGAATPASYGATISVDLRTFESRRVALRRHPDCVVCADVAGDRQAVG